MKQVIRRGLSEIIVDEVADPVARPNHVLIRPYYSLISSGTETADIHTGSLVREVADNPSHLKSVWAVMRKTDPISTIREVRARFNDYAVLGYSGAGIVVEKHDGVTDLAVGERVAYGGEGAGHGETIMVGRNLVARVPDVVDFRAACFTTLGAIAMNAVRLAEIGIGETVAVIGLGIVGQLIAQIVRCQGGVPIAIDLNADRVELARATGADFGLVAGETTVAEVKALTARRGADCVIVAAASKSATPLEQAARMSRDRGRIVVVGACPIEIPRSEMYIKELKVLMSRAYGPGSYDAAYERRGVDYPLPFVRWTENRNMQEVLRLMAVGKIDVKPLISHEYPLEDAPKAYDTIMSGGGRSSLAVVLRYPVNDVANPFESYTPKRRITIDGSSARTGEIRFALVGAGNLAKWAHLPALKKISGARLHAVYSAHGARGKAYALRFGAGYHTSDLDVILNDEAVDVVLIASRHNEHAAQAVAALRAGKHVFVEKPMGITIDECQAIVRAVKESGKQLAVGFNRRYAPFYVEMKQHQTGRTGPAVIAVRMNSPGIENGWAAEVGQGGVVLGEACHFVDLMYWLLESEPVSVSAYGFDRHNIAASMKFADGSIGTLVYTVVGSDSSGGEFVEAFAPGIGVAAEDFKRLAVKKQARRQQSRWFAQKGYTAQLECFVRSLRDGKPTDVTVRDGTRATLGCLLMMQSAQSGQPRVFDLETVLAES